MNQFDERETEICNEFDYSNAIVEIQSISYLIQYCDTLFKQYMNMVNLDEQRNEKLKYEFRNYEYRKSYNAKFEISIRGKDYNYSNLNCKSYYSFIEAVNNGHLKNVGSVIITLDLSYRRGQEINLMDYENNFKFTFKPYEIKFVRKSNHNEESTNQLENNFNQILKQFKVANSIFCTK